MLTLEKYLEEIRRDRAAGWSRVFKDILGQPLSDKERFLKAVDNYGELIIFESLVITSTKKINNDPLNYVLAVAAKKWKEDLISLITSDQEDIKANKSIEQSQKDSLLLFERIEAAKRRVHESNDPL
jgi:hypothetical protein